MKEKFADYESAGFLSQAGDFEFEIVSAELKASKKGEPMWAFEVNSDEGSTTIYHSLNSKARWSLNNLVKACLKLDSKEKIDAFEFDYETDCQNLVGKKFIGVVVCEPYVKDIKIMQPDGTFTDGQEKKDGFKIKEYKMITPKNKK